MFTKYDFMLPKWFTLEARWYVYHMRILRGAGGPDPVKNPKWL